MSESDRRSGGFIVLHRKVYESKIWNLLTAAERMVWITLLFEARWPEEPRHTAVGPVHRGQTVLSERRLAEVAKVTRKVVTRALAKLEQDGAIRRHRRSQHGSVITVVNYRKYQDVSLPRGAKAGANAGATSGATSGADHNQGTITTTEPAVPIIGTVQSGGNGVREFFEEHGAFRPPEEVAAERFPATEALRQVLAARGFAVQHSRKPAVQQAVEAAVVAISKREGVQEAAQEVLDEVARLRTKGKEVGSTFDWFFGALGARAAAGKGDTLNVRASPHEEFKPGGKAPWEK